MRTPGVEDGKRLLAVAAALAAALAVGPPPASGQTLREDLDRALTVSGVSRARTGAFALDLQSGRVVYDLHPGRSLRPASNEKLAVALAALERLGPEHRIPTRVLGAGSRAGSTWRGRLVLRGFGDPTLTRADLRRLASKLRSAGIRRVTGHIAGDESYFDRRRTADGWKPSYYKIQSPPLSALVVDRARSDGRTVGNPAFWAAKAFRKALVGTGISVGGKAVRGTAPNGARMLAAVRSQTIKALVKRMNKVSDNFYAEMLVKRLGARVRGMGSTRAGCLVVRSVLAARNIPLAGVRIVDGSGLSHLDRATAKSLGRLLVSAWRDPALRLPFFSSLAIAGVDGTLEDRMRRGPAHGRVRAKTGTTSRASALSGFVGTRYVFAILQNGNPINWTKARRAQDRFAQRLARSL
jgi:D-alanyl-D-alanine carboxypeptidase/D-alanyl-D-alanine-endopeptidase (penicillin-binding protein 4)